MNIPVYIIILFVILVLCLTVIIIFSKTERFNGYPPSMISAGDFHIQQQGAIADEGSFVNDMDSYIEGQGEI